MNRRELDELRKILVQREEEKEKLLGYYNKMEAELQQEQAVAANDPNMAAMFVKYKQLLRERQATITKSVLDIDKQLQALMEQIADKFNEVKKYEILLASKLTALHKEELAAETKQLDAIALGNYLNNY